MRCFIEKMERSVTQANCNPIGYMLALAVIVGGVAYHFRDAVLNVIKDTVMILAAAFLVYAVIHITSHIIRHRRRLAQSQASAQDAAEPDNKAVDPVEEAERVVSEAFHGLGSKATQDGSGRVK